MPISRNIRKMPSARPTSPMAFITNAFLAAATAAACAVPEADQQVGRETDEAPAGQQEHEVRRPGPAQHREDEQVQVGEEAPLLVVAVHVADRVDVDQEPDAGDDRASSTTESGSTRMPTSTWNVPDVEPASTAGRDDAGAASRSRVEQLEEDDERRATNDASDRERSATRRGQPARRAMPAERYGNARRPAARASASQAAVESVSSAASSVSSIDVEQRAAARERDDQAEADDDLGRGDGHHRSARRPARRGRRT